MRATLVESCYAAQLRITASFLKGSLPKGFACFTFVLCFKLFFLAQVYFFELHIDFFLSGKLHFLSVSLPASLLHSVTLTKLDITTSCSIRDIVILYLGNTQNIQQIYCKGKWAIGDTSAVGNETLMLGTFVRYVHQHLRTLGRKKIRDIEVNSGQYSPKTWRLDCTTTVCSRRASNGTPVARVRACVSG